MKIKPIYMAKASLNDTIKLFLSANDTNHFITSVRVFCFESPWQEVRAALCCLTVSRLLHL